MQEVKQALETFASARRMDGTGEDVALPDFTEVATNWSAYCLHHLRGDLMRLGLDIARALSEYDRGLKYPETLKD